MNFLLMKDFMPIVVQFYLLYICFDNIFNTILIVQQMNFLDKNYFHHEYKILLSNHFKFIIQNYH